MQPGQPPERTRSAAGGRAAAGEGSSARRTRARSLRSGADRPAPAALPGGFLRQQYGQQGLGARVLPPGSEAAQPARRPASSPSSRAGLGASPASGPSSHWPAGASPANQLTSWPARRRPAGYDSSRGPGYDQAAGLGPAGLGPAPVRQPVGAQPAQPRSWGQQAAAASPPSYDSGQRDSSQPGYDSGSSHPAVGPARAGA
jgi:hypothetical protein